MDKPKPKTLMDQAREVRALLGEEGVSIDASPEGVAIIGPQRDVALYGTATGGWRSKNAKIIARLAKELEAKGTVNKLETATA